MAVYDRVLVLNNGRRKTDATTPHTGSDRLALTGGRLVLGASSGFAIPLNGKIKRMQPGDSFSQAAALFSVDVTNIQTGTESGGACVTAPINHIAWSTDGYLPDYQVDIYWEQVSGNGFTLLASGIDPEDAFYDHTITGNYDVTAASTMVYRVHLRFTGTSTEATNSPITDTISRTIAACFV